MESVSNILDTFTTIIMGGKLFGNETVQNCFVHVSVINEYSRLTQFFFLANSTGAKKS